MFKKLTLTLGSLVTYSDILSLVAAFISGGVFSRTFVRGFLEYNLYQCLPANMAFYWHYKMGILFSYVELIYDNKIIQQLTISKHEN